MTIRAMIRPARQSVRQSLVLTMSLALVGIGIPRASSAGAPESVLRGSHYARFGQRVVHVDFSPAEVAQSALLRGEGSFRVVLRGAVFPIDPAPKSSRPRAEGAGHGPVLLGSDPRTEVLEATGQDLAGVREWHPIISWTMSGDRDYLTSTFRTAQDTFSISLPRGSLVRQPDATRPVTVEVNGKLIELDPTTIQDASLRWSASEDAEQTDRPAALDELVLHLADRTTFVGAFNDLSMVTGLVVAGSGDAVDFITLHGRTCTATCLGCGAAMSMTALAMARTVIACSAAGLTAGGGIAACVWSMIAQQANAIAAFAACGACNECVTSDPPEPGGGDSGGGADPSGDCPEGYHECANNMCCCDLCSS